jgi:hypothetical protein
MDDHEIAPHLPTDVSELLNDVVARGAICMRLLRFEERYLDERIARSGSDDCDALWRTRAYRARC